MNARGLILFGLPMIIACSSDDTSSSDTNGGSGGEAAAAGGNAGDVTGGSGGTTGGFAGETNGGTSNLAGGGTDAGGSSGAGGSESGGAGAGGDSGGAAGSGGSSAGGSGNFVPAEYTGTPFKGQPLTIPGFIYGADYDSGGSAVAYCRVGAANPPTVDTCGTAKLDDWCCGFQVRCDQRNQPDLCPIYRENNDNCGLSHLNHPEPDNFAADQPSWIAGPNGPTLTGPAVTVGQQLPYHDNMTTADDTYISYMFTGQWERYTVQVMEAGTYSIGGLMATPPGTQIRFDFEGTAVTSGIINVPPSPTPQTEAYHEWLNSADIGQVTFPQAGTYLMRFTLVAQQFNPLFFTFTKM
jgi:hypothetical protein